MHATRARLPAYSCRQQVLNKVAAHDVVVISGATGCGKSTQVPQYLLEEAIAAGSGGATNIIVCQPRRIAAVGLATRVSAEVGDPRGVGGIVGYSVRLDSRVSAATRLLFCTTGVLLRRLISDPQLSGVTHVVLDEVHERNLESDLLLLLLREALLTTAAGCSTGKPRSPKVVLMSATADAQLFADYFANAGPEAMLLQGQRQANAVSKPKPMSASQQLSAGMLSIPGFTHPVRQLWLEDALQHTGIVIGKQSRYAKRKIAKSATVPTKDGSTAYEASPDQDSDDSDEADSWEDQQQQQQHTVDSSWEENTQSAPSRNKAGPNADAPSGSYSHDVLRSLQTVDPSMINHELIEALVVHIATVQQQSGPAALLKGWQSAPSGALEAAAAACANGQLGAILIFMPGAPEIDRLVRQLQSSNKLAAAMGPNLLRVLPLHGALPPAVQARVFERPPRGTLKVVVATNIAETSLTIDDVMVVIDTGRHKEMSYDPTRGLSCLTEAWVSQAAAQQRRGRAGRVAPGTCYRLWPAAMWGRLAPQQLPEVLRSPLQQLCLMTKAALAATSETGDICGSCTPILASVLSRLLTPPNHGTVNEAVQQLTQLGALSPGSEELTPLGQHLTAMPMDPALGKALLYGCMLRCASPLLTVAAALVHGQPLWVSPPPDRRADATAARQALAPQAISQRSDHLAVIAAFNGWSAAKASGGRSASVDFCQQYFVSEQVLEAIANGRLDFASTLQQLGFLPQWYCSHLRSLQQRQQQDLSSSGKPGAWSDVYNVATMAAGAPDEYSHNARIVKGAICAGFYPRILRVEAPVRYQQVQGGAMRVEADPASIKFYERNLGRVWMHPASVCFSAGSYPSGWLVFTQLVKTSRSFVREASMVPLYALLAFGGELEVLHDQGLLLLDGWARFKAPARVGVLIKHLRTAVAALLAAKVADPSLELAGQRVVETLHALLATDGF
eukprot:GHRR01020897.1.p1 GENE.GHRR01020897.1~~GHRR01020897.1.p1  ORF type:complete len:959 (+),score=404.55 GHRR01020897.1:326-3202(+)